jgi:plastocyanin
MRQMVLRGGFVSVLLIGSTMWAWPASAGGDGCRGGATQGTGDTVTMSKACFTPSVLRVDPGTEVTFVNQDPMPHNLSAIGWGRMENMNEGDAFRATFDERGVYPYACTYHYGMTGAVVVGNGLGPGSGDTVTVAPLADAANMRTTPAATTARETSATGWAVSAAGGAILGAAAAVLLRRRTVSR